MTSPPSNTCAGAACHNLEVAFFCWVLFRFLNDGAPYSKIVGLSSVVVVEYFSLMYLAPWVCLFIGLHVQFTQERRKKFLLYKVEELLAWRAAEKKRNGASPPQQASGCMPYYVHVIYTRRKHKSVAHELGT